MGYSVNQTGNPRRILDIDKEDIEHMRSLDFSAGPPNYFLLWFHHEIENN